MVNKYLEENYSAMIQGALFNESIFNASRFLVNNMPKKNPPGISKVSVFYALASLGFKYENYKTARFGYEQLQNLKVPAAWIEEIEVDHIKLRAKPFSDKDDFSWICNRCMNVNPLINEGGDFCVHCGMPCMRNFGSFDTLPLVEFMPHKNIPEMQVLQLLRMDPPENEQQTTNSAPRAAPKRNGDGWNENNEGEEQTLTFQQNEGMENDLFAQRMLEWVDSQVSPDRYKPVEVDEEILRNMRFEEVYIIDMKHFSKAMPQRYFKNMSPEVAITKCEHCNRFFIQDEYEFAYMDQGYCPFCKHVEKDKGAKAVYGSLADMQQ